MYFMRTAHEANEASKFNDRQERKRALFDTAEMIDRAVRKGDFSIDLFIGYQEVYSQLQSLGYQVIPIKDAPVGWYTISWEKG